MAYAYTIVETLHEEIKKHQVNSSTPKNALKIVYHEYMKKHAVKNSNVEIKGKIINEVSKRIAKFQILFDEDGGIRYVMGTFRDVRTHEEFPKLKPVIVMEEASDFKPRKIYSKKWFEDIFIPKKLFDELKIEKDVDSLKLNLFKIMKGDYRVYKFAFDTKTKLLLVDNTMINKEFFERYVSNGEMFDISNFVVGHMHKKDEVSTIHFMQYNMDAMTNKVSSRKIVETIKMFMNHGLREEDEVSFRGYKVYAAKYFLKAKVLW